MEFRTPVQTDPFPFSIGHRQSGLLVGSCFAQEMAARLHRAKFPVVVNPYGVLYNPLSVAGMFRSLASGRRYAREDLVRDGDLWVSFDHHGDFSGTGPDKVLEGLNRAADEGRAALAAANYVIITLGTAWVYERRDTGKAVANCHKFHPDFFIRRRMSVEEIVNAFVPLLETAAGNSSGGGGAELGGAAGKRRQTAVAADGALAAAEPGKEGGAGLPSGGALSGKRVILTVSPVRHLKDGLTENSLSKASLIVAAHALAERFPDVYYFPAYEMLVDDLRDYRFYGPDMLHPSSTAVDYVWEKFVEAVVSPHARELLPRIARITAAAAHRPLNPDTKAHRGFMDRFLGETKRLQEEHPELDLTDEIGCFSGD